WSCKEAMRTRYIGRMPQATLQQELRTWYVKILMVYAINLYRRLSKLQLTSCRHRVRRRLGRTSCNFSGKAP
ncbi:hypothetical protein PIB30_014667, partial [Stylosanthes scabra]|nr:hypothetical protein [Stylosanthes scabra]